MYCSIDFLSCLLYQSSILEGNIFHDGYFQVLYELNITEALTCQLHQYSSYATYQKKKKTLYAPV